MDDRSIASRLEAWWAGAEVRLEKSRGGRVVADAVRAARTVIHGFRGEKIALRASALTYITMLSIVPLLAVVFAIVRAAGQESLRRAVHEFVFSNLAPGVAEQIGGYLDEFIARASASAMGGLGGLVLLASAIGLFHNIERSLDEIWGVTRPRTIFKRAIIYWCVLTLGPIAIGVSALASGMARSYVAHALPAGMLALVPWASSVFLFAFLYYGVPNAKVSRRATLVGALVAATAWEIAKLLYAFFATHSFRYNAIYGSVGAIPLFLLWVYVSWLIVLFGARLAYALQYAITTARLGKVDDARAREVLCARIVLEAVVAFQLAKPAPKPGTFARDLGLDVVDVADAIDLLKQGGLLAEGVNGGVVPGRAPEQIRLVDVAEAAGGTLFDFATEAPSEDASTKRLAEVFAAADKQGRELLAQVDLAALAKPLLEAKTAGKEKAGNPAP